MKRKWIIIALCVVAIVAAAIGVRLTVQAVASPPADQTGPYKVGFVANTYYDSTRSDNAEGARPIMTYIWYPAAPENNEKPMPPAVYPFNPSGINGLPVFSSTDFEAYGIDPAYQEVAASKDGPFPLVVLSPGLPGHSLLYVHIGARLASHGFVVAIPISYGDGMLGEPTWEPNSPSYMIGTYVERTKDIQYLMTRLVADSQQSSNLLYGTVQADQIAVAGHSWGGLAALALAGGDDQACDSPRLDPNKIPPETCVPILPDPRIKAIVPLDPSSDGLQYAEMARIKIPSMIIGEEWNTLKSIPGNFETLLARPHSAIQGHPNYRVDIASYQHMSLSSACASMKVFRDYGINDDKTTDMSLKVYCPQEPMPPDEIGNLATRYMIAFLKTVLVGDSGYKEMLTPDYALKNELSIEFFETEKGSSNTVDEDGYFSYFMHQPGSEQAKALKDP